MNEPSAPDSAAVAAETGAFAKNVAGAASGSHSMLERAGEAVAAVKLGSRVIPAAWRFARRRPWAASLATLVLLGAAVVILPRIRAFRDPPA